MAKRGEEEEEKQRLELEGLLSWAANLGISDFASTTIDHGSAIADCLGHTLSVAHFPDAGGRGLGTVRDTRRGELVLKVPQSALVTTSSLLNSDPHLSGAVNLHPSLSDSQKLTVCLLHEMAKAKKSWWYRYLSNLPRHYDTLATFSQFEMEALQVEDALWAAKKAKSKAVSEWKHARPLMEQLNFTSKFLSFKSWLWASSTISSRTLHVPWDEAGCLCPIGDLFNYAAPGEGSEDVENDMNLANSTQSCNAEEVDAPAQRLIDGGFEEDAAAYCFYARENYKKGEQVLLSYGTYTNLELMEYYGFLLNENPNDKVYIPLEEGVYSSSSWSRELLYVHQNGKPSFALLCAMRLWATPPNKRRCIGHLAYSGAPVSSENENYIMSVIAEWCWAALNKLQTTMEEDSGFLLQICDENNERCSPLEACRARSVERLRLAVEWRLRYKRTLVDCILYCNSAKCSKNNEDDLRAISRIIK